MNYAKAQIDLKEKYPPILKSERRGIISNAVDIELSESHYFHNYLFRHNEKRCYRNKLTLIGDGVVYLGVTLKDKTNRHWTPYNSMESIVAVRKSVLPKDKKQLVDIKLSEYQEKVAKNNPNGIRVFTGKNRWYILTETNLTVHPYKGKCCYCEIDLYYSLNYTRDHVIPKSKGGRAGKNLKPCCAHCNSEKGDLLLSAYIQKLNYSLYGVVGGPLYDKIQTKIKNANLIAQELTH